MRYPVLGREMAGSTARQIWRRRALPNITTPPTVQTAVNDAAVRSIHDVGRQHPRQHAAEPDSPHQAWLRHHAEKRERLIERSVTLTIRIHLHRQRLTWLITDFVVLASGYLTIKDLVDPGHPIGTLVSGGIGLTGCAASAAWATRKPMPRRPTVPGADDENQSG